MLPGISAVGVSQLLREQFSSLRFVLEVQIGNFQGLKGRKINVGYAARDTPVAAHVIPYCRYRPGFLGQ